MRYRDVYPEAPVLRSNALVAPSARDLLSLEYFEAAPGSMDEAVFEEHHVLVNLKDEPSRVENWRDGEHRDFVLSKSQRETQMILCQSRAAEADGTLKIDL